MIDRHSVQRACEAVGWSSETALAGGAYAWDGVTVRFSEYDLSPERWRADALRLLEAWRERDPDVRRVSLTLQGRPDHLYSVSASIPGETFGGESDDLVEAAVFAVLGWHESPKDESRPVEGGTGG